MSGEGQGGGECQFMGGVTYNELSQKTRFQSVPIAAFCIYNIQRENLVFKNSLCMSRFHFLYMLILI